MTEIKIVAKLEDRHHFEQWAIAGFTFWKFISQELDNGVPKYEILVISSPPPHSQIKEIEDNKISFITGRNNPVENENYSYEISFTDDESLLKKEDGKNVRDEDKHKRIFFQKTNITIKDNSYSAKLEQLKNQSNLMPEEISQWKDFIGYFRNSVANIEDKSSIKYKEGKKFAEELETELNKKTGKDDDRERERERESKIKELCKRIAKLEKKVNRTSQEEQELQDKKQELAKLEKEKQEGGGSKKPFNWTPWLIGGGVILVLAVGIIAYFLWVKQSPKE
ncbi:MAG: hypothetical protein MRERC_9c051 [Mycoplasmataceae bacterium RC_NB112A]|nr:MAG: hypothetical protein MRERC_9c051 [Mycoplasmataceae bacterium RC_NB112A]